MNRSRVVAGIDIGGSHITAALIDLTSGSVVPGTCHRRSIDPDGLVPDIIAEWTSVITKAFNGNDIRKRLGIAIPGPFDYDEGISQIKNQNKYDSLYGLNVKDLLAESLQIRGKDIFFRNDAACFLQGEVLGGAAKGYKNAIGLALGTGLGSARSKENIAEDADLWQSPFLEGIAEDYLSTRWFVNRFYEITGKSIQNVKELAELNPAAHPVHQIFGEFGKNLAGFLTDLILLEDPEVIVIGGNIANAFPLFYPELSNHLPGRRRFVLKKAVLGEQGNLVGAAACWYNHLKSDS